MSREKLEQGLEQHQAGQLEEAAAIYQAVLAEDPNNADALHFLGLIFQQRGTPDQATEHIKRAISLAPERSTFHFNLAVIYSETGDLDKAVAAYQQATSLKPDWLDAYINLGTILGRLKDYPAAEIQLRQALAIEADNPAALIGLTAALDGQGLSAEAEQIGRQAVAQAPKNPAAWINLGNALNRQRRSPNKLAAAEDAFRRALALDPRAVTAQFNLGNVLNDQWRKSEALACFQAAIDHDPSYQDAWQNLLINSLYDPAATEQTIFTAHQAWSQQLSRNIPQLAITTKVAADRRLRIGYVSPDFRTHSCAYFLKPLLAHHDSAAFEIFAYANVAKEDETTAWFKAHVDHWCDVTVLSDTDMAACIRRDKIDILVDLAGHSANNRLAVFALKPAPIQISWLGYPATTGLTEIDFRLTDSIADPPNSAASTHSETLIPLDGGFHCYQPPDNLPKVGPLPAVVNDFVTFGSFNHIAKITPTVIAAWANILNTVPNSKLCLKGGMLNYEIVTDSIRTAFETQNIAAERLLLNGWIMREDNPLALYNSVDICLDTFPYNGTTTSFEALVMGVPIITLRGTRHAGRVGASILSHLGHPEWIAENIQDYISQATALAADRSDLQNIRRNLRGELSVSSLGLAQDFATKIEAAYSNIHAKAVKGDQIS